MKKTVLIVDDSIYMRSLIKTALESEGFEVVGEAADGSTAIEMALEHEPDLITLDNILPDMKGFNVLKVLKEEGIECKTIVVSAVGQQAVIDNLIELGALEYIVKPFTNDQLKEAVKKVMDVATIEH